jgi:hypothetical protein
VTGLGEGGALPVVGGLEFSRQDVAAGFVELPVVDPVDVLQGGNLSTCSAVRHRPRGLISSVLTEPFSDSARELPCASPTVPTEALALRQPSGLPTPATPVDNFSIDVSRLRFLLKKRSLRTSRIYLIDFIPLLPVISYRFSRSPQVAYLTDARAAAAEHRRAG